MRRRWRCISNEFIWSRISSNTNSFSNSIFNGVSCGCGSSSMSTSLRPRDEGHKYDSTTCSRPTRCDVFISNEFLRSRITAWVIVTNSAWPMQYAMAYLPGIVQSGNCNKQCVAYAVCSGLPAWYCTVR